MKLVLIGVLAAGCFTSSPPPISNAGGPGPRPSALESWIGTGQQSSGSEWTIELQLRPDAEVGERLGTIAYPSLGCSGEWIRVPDPDRTGGLVAIENLLVNPDDVCADHGTVVVTGGDQILEYRWEDATGAETALATLRRAPR